MAMAGADCIVDGGLDSGDEEDFGFGADRSGSRWKRPDFGECAGANNAIRLRTRCITHSRLARSTGEPRSAQNGRSQVH